MGFLLHFLLLVSFVIIGEQSYATESYSHEYYKPAYNEVYAYKGPQKTPQQTLEDMKKLSNVFENNLSSSSIKFMKNEVDQLIIINEWPAECTEDSLKKIKNFIRSEKSWQLYIVPYLRYQMDRICADNEDYNEAKRAYNEAVENIDKDDDRKLSEFIAAIEKHDKKAAIYPPYYDMPALVFRSGVIEYMKSNSKLDKKTTLNEFREIFNNSLVKMCKRYLEKTTPALESIKKARVHLFRDFAEDIYPDIHTMWFRKQACTYATNTKFDLSGEIYELYKHPTLAKLNYKKRSFRS